MMNLARHLVGTRWTLTRRFDAATLGAIEQAVALAEAVHRGEIRFAIEAALDLHMLWRDRTPRDRAREVFVELGVWDTAERSGVLIYVLIAEHSVEIVADRGCDGRIGEDEWRDVCAEMQAAFRAGRWREGAVRGVEEVSRLLAREFPRVEGRIDVNELPNRPALL
jgi:uncharacterized membrane protein